MSKKTIELFLLFVKVIDPSKLGNFFLYFVTNLLDQSNALSLITASKKKLAYNMLTTFGF